MDNIFALVDCNSFYASCERVFNPALRNRPIIVLSNNDGCVIARSSEAKLLGVRMAVPFFECKELVRQHHIAVYSSNFALYGDMSERVMNTLADLVPELEIYSIDEAFLHLTGMPADDLTRYAHVVKNMVGMQTGIPVSIGIGSTKTLAKLANKAAKEAATDFVCNLVTHPHPDQVLEQMEVVQVWGIGPRSAAHLNRYGIQNARQFRDLPDAWIQEHLSITGLKTAWELRGISCTELEDTTVPQKSVITSRSFQHAVTTLPALEEAVAEYISRATEKLRSQHCLTSRVHVYLTRTESFDTARETVSANTTLHHPTAHTPELIHAAQHNLRALFKPDFRYKRAGVMLTELITEDQVQPSLFREPSEYTLRKQRLMTCVDTVNMEWGSATMKFAAEGLRPSWKTKQVNRSPRFTTRWDELPVVHA